MKKAITLVTFLCMVTLLRAEGPWKITLHCPEEKIDLHLDLYEESIEVPGFEAFGPMNGYLGGNIYGVWYVVTIHHSAFLMFWEIIFIYKKTLLHIGTK